MKKLIGGLLDWLCSQGMTIPAGWPAKPLGMRTLQDVAGRQRLPGSLSVNRDGTDRFSTRLVQEWIFGLRREQTLALQIEVPDDFLSRFDGNIADKYLFDVSAVFHEDCHGGIVIFGLCRRQLAGNLFLGVIPGSNGNAVLAFGNAVEAVSAAGIRLRFDAAALPFALLGIHQQDKSIRHGMLFIASKDCAFESYRFLSPGRLCVHDKRSAERGGDQGDQDNCRLDSRHALLSCLFGRVRGIAPLTDKILETRFSIQEELWRAKGDDLRTFLGEFVAILRQVEFPPD